MAELWLIRHGETEWSLSGAHTSRTDIALTEHGRKRAEELREFLNGKKFAAVLSSPMQRARETCAIAGYGDVAVIEDGLKEWDYGIYEGKTTKEIRGDDAGMVGVEGRDRRRRDAWSMWASARMAVIAEGAGGGGGRRQRGAVCACAYPADSGGAVDRTAGDGRQPADAGDRVGERAGV